MTKTLMDELGGLFMVGFHGDSFDHEIRSLIDQLRPAGVILFKRNILSPLQVAELNHQIQSYAIKKLNRGLFIGVDQEGGRVRRLFKPFSEFGPAKSLAESPDPAASVRDFASTTANELRMVGFNVDFAPVMDVVQNGIDQENSVIGDRSYGSDPLVVAELGKLVIETMRQNGIIPCSKHFPGHGGVTVDSHLELPVDEREYELIESKDLLPFRMAIESRVEMIMTAHVLHTAIDNELPATVSPEALQKLLRRDMKYSGVIVTDDLDMGAITTRFETNKAGTLAKKAGADLLLICNKPEKAFTVKKSIGEALKNGDIGPENVQKSLERLQRLRDIYHDSMVPCDLGKVTERFPG